MTIIVLEDGEKAIVDYLSKGRYDRARSRNAETLPLNNTNDKYFSDRTGYTTPTWGDVIMMLPHRYSLNWSSTGGNATKICLIRDTWSTKSGEMTAMIALGTSKSYPYCSMLTNTEAKVLMATDKFTEGA